MFNIQSITTILYSLPAVFIGLTFHEFAHAWMATRLGDTLPRSQGRLTLDPFAHIDWIGMACFVLLGFGWAKPVQVNVRSFKNPKRDDILVSVAGPVSNLLLAIAFSIVTRLLTHIPLAGMTQTIVWNLLNSIIHINIVLFILNLLPIPPLDGWHVLKNFIPYQHWKNVLQFEQYGFIVIILLSMTGVLSKIIGFGVLYLRLGIDSLLWLLPR